MTKKIKIISSLLMLMVCMPVFGTAQALDLLIFKADTLPLMGLPLTQYPDQSQIEPRRIFKGEGCMNTGNYRQYIATWIIENDKLYLFRIKNDCYGSGDNNQSVEYANLNMVFPNRCENGKVLADWFSGLLYFPIGKRVFVDSDGNAVSYEKELELNIQNGMLIGEKILDNSKSRQIRYDSLDNGKYFDSMINWTIIPKIAGGEIRVRVQFSANEDGIIDDIRVYPPRGDVFESEAIRVVRTLPGNVQIYHGKLRRQHWVMPVIFKETSRKR